jgi:hypothetical protein
MNRKNIYIHASVAIALCILVLSLIPAVRGGFNSGNINHMIAYFVLSMCIWLHLSRKGVGFPYLLAAVSAGTYGALVEFIQYFIRYRKCDVDDVVSNFLGAFSIIVPVLIIGWISRRSRSASGREPRGR